MKTSVVIYCGDVKTVAVKWDVWRCARCGKSVKVVMV